MPCAFSPTIRYVLCPFCTVELDPTCSMKTNQGFSAWDEGCSSFENHQPVTGIGWNGSFSNFFFLMDFRISLHFTIFHVRCLVPKKFWSDLSEVEDLKPLHIWLLWFTTTTACLAPWPLSMGILGCRIHDCGRRRLARRLEFIGHFLFSPNGCIYVGLHTSTIEWHIDYKTKNMIFGFVSNS